MDDTRTRKTLKLKPVKQTGLTSIDGNKPGLGVVDPLTQRNTETGPLSPMDDTRTRKTVKLKVIKKEGLSVEDVQEGSLKPVVDPLTQRNTETGPLGPMDDTRTRKTVSLKPKAQTPPPIDIDAAKSAAPEAGAPQMMQETHTRKTLKLKPITPGEEKPPIALSGTGEGASMQDTRTRKTLKLKPITPGEEKPPIAVESGDDDTRTRKTLKLTPAKKTTALSAEDISEPEEAAAPSTEADTIKIERPKPKADAMPMPSLGAPAAAKTVNNKDTVKLRPPTDEAIPAGDEAATMASKDTIKLSPQPEEKIAEEKEKEAPTVNLKLDAKKATKSKLTIGKVPPPKTPAKPEVEAKPEEAEETPAEKNGNGGDSGLKLKEFKRSAEAPRAQADLEKIQGMKTGKKDSSASMFYTMVAVVTLVLVAFSAMATAVQYFNLWDLKTIGGKAIELPYLKDLGK